MILRSLAFASVWSLACCTSADALSRQRGTRRVVAFRGGESSASTGIFHKQRKEEGEEEGRPLGLPAFTPESFGELDGHRDHEAGAGLDAANRRSMYLIVRRLILIGVFTNVLIHGIGYIVFSRDRAARFVDPSCVGGNRMAASLGMLTVMYALTNLLLVWFGDDRIVKTAVRVAGAEFFLGFLFVARHVYTGAWAWSDNIGPLTCWPIVAGACGYFGRQL